MLVFCHFFAFFSKTKPPLQNLGKWVFRMVINFQKYITFLKWRLEENAFGAAEFLNLGEKFSKNSKCLEFAQNWREGVKIGLL